MQTTRPDRGQTHRIVFDVDVEQRERQSDIARFFFHAPRFSSVTTMV